MRILRICLVLALSAALATSVSYAQAVNATLLGNVTDSSGATVPGAKVTVTEMNTGVGRSMESNESGNYVFPNLEPGVYKVTVERNGFRTAVKEGVTLLVNTTGRADMVLQPGQVNESVTISAEAAMLQTDRADVGRKIESAQLANLPVGYSRNFQSLLNLVPGTTRSFQPHSEFFNSQGSLTSQVNGVSRLGNNVQFEGVDNNHRTGLLTVLVPPIEALQTVDVSTSNYEAELGRAGGAVTNIFLKSGTNEIHGGAYWFHSDSALAARETFQPTKPVTTYNYYGFNLGGPIRKNRTFIFGDFLQVKDRRGDGYIITLPGADFRAGNFSSQISRAVVYDPASGSKDTGVGRTPFAGNIIPDNRISPIAKKVLSFVPLPNLGSGLTNNYASSTTRKKDTDSFDIKVDHSQTDNDRFSVRYSFQRPVVTDPGRFGIYGGGGKGFAATGTNRTQSTAVNYTHVFSPTLVSEFRVGLGRYSNKAQNLDYGTQASAAIGIAGANLDNWSSGISSMNVSGYANPLVGYSASLPWNRAETNIDMVANVTKIFQNHTIKIGADLRRLRDELLQTQDAGGPRGEFQFGNNQSSAPGGAVLAQVNGLASFLLDSPSLVQRDLAIAFPAYRAWMLFTYIQDKWQVSPKLTIDLGVRHDYYPPATPRLAGGFSNYDPATNSLLVAGYGNNAMNLGRKNFYTNFAPRIGVAYRFNPKTVFRAGYGMSWIPFPDNKYAWDNFPVKQSNQYPAATTYGLSQTPTGQYLSMSTGFPAPAPAVIPSNGIILANTPQLLSQNIASLIPLDYHEGYIESWNFAIQHELPRNFTLDVAYVGNHTVRAPVTYNLNAGFLFNAGNTGRPYYQKFGKSADINYRYAGYSNNYNALQVKLDRRFSGGFMLTTGYTYSKALGYSAEDGGMWNYLQPRRSYARLDFDRAHTFVQSYLYQLPFGKNGRWLKSGPGRWVLGDWQVNGVLTLMTGRPMTFGTTVSANTPGSSITPDIVGNFTVSHAVAGPSGSATWFDTSAFKQPLDADGKTPHFGNTGRNAFNGPGLFNIDFSVFRKFQVTERVKGELRFESTNFTNTPAFGNPSTTVGSADFGRVTGTLAGLIANQGVGGTGSRGIQLGLRFTF
ncbi:MAG: TonB-dependent receptor [Acidobacteria bacterium]|nr:TonB-dependent receptor [Acidobacteriota bacterium]